MNVESYAAIALQVTCKAVNLCSTVADARRQMLDTIAHCDQLIKGSKGFVGTFSGDDVRLVVLPEYFLTGFPMGESIADWANKACLKEQGPEYEDLCKLAQSNNVYLSGNAYELDSNFPNLYFQTSFIINDSGNVILRYRRLVSMFAPTPHDILDAYLDVYGEDALFPVADTELGKLACVASEEILYPEITRALALKGAEVICHSSSEVGSHLATPKNIAKQARAYENMLYVVSANSAGIEGIPFPAQSTDGYSQVVDYKGQVMAQADSGESMCGVATLDIEALRGVRRKPAMTNLLARQRLELFSRVYSGQSVYPANNMLDNGEVKVPDRSHFINNQQVAIDKLKDQDII